FQAFRARLVDTVDVVLDQLDRDPEWSFVLDGQTIVIEDYLAVRPAQTERLRRSIRSGRLAIGPWYVQPDSLLPGGETHVRNLLEGRRVGEQFGPVSSVAYTPDSFGHPAQFPQLFAGFGLDGFVYWRGNGDELDHLSPVYRWVAPNGSSVVACLLTNGYFSAAYLPDDVAAAAGRLHRLGDQMVNGGATRLLFMNGVDHALPDTNTAEVARALADETGWSVHRGRLEDFTLGAIASVDGSDTFTGELTGGRIANLLPGVWSTRTYLKLASRAAETALVGWAEPWAAFAAALGVPDERASLRLAWRALLANQAHDSIGGCSQDRVHRQMQPRFDEAIELADETTDRVLSRLAGLGRERAIPWSDAIDVAVFNPSPHPRTDVVRFPIDGHPQIVVAGDRADVHPLTMLSLVGSGVDVDGTPARIVADESPARYRLLADQAAWTAEWVAADVPAFGWRRYRLSAGEPSPDEQDHGRTIGTGGLSVTADDFGTLTVAARGGEYRGLLAVDDQGDRGDTYDFDPVPGDARLADVAITRRRHPTGIQELEVARTFDVPVALAPSRDERSEQSAECAVRVTARVAPGVERVDLDVVIENNARDHRLRLAFPTGASGVSARAATTFDVARRAPRVTDSRGWVQPAPRTFPHQGWVRNNGLTVVAPGLPEAEVDDDGTIYITALRAVGSLSRVDLRGRPQPAGPGLRTPEAQCRGTMAAQLALAFGSEPSREALNAELGLRAVPAGPNPIVPEGSSLMMLEGEGVVL
ncbi:MAG: hypothetical protein JO075_04450, partial [Acidimicrobiia bacterium]|nr:hypothetical protein [Acidimicrobiia bacterium]